MTPLLGESIRLRLVREDDLDKLIDLMNDLTTRGTIEHHLYSETEIRSEFADNGYWASDSGMLLMVDRDDEIVGWVDFVAIVYFLRGYEISYQIFGEQHSGKGYATEALDLFTDYLFSTKQINRLQLTINPRNQASKRVAAKCGYALEGVMRAAQFFEGSFQDVELWSITRDDVAQS